MLLMQVVGLKSTASGAARPAVGQGQAGHMGYLESADASAAFVEFRLKGLGRVGRWLAMPCSMPGFCCLLGVGEGGSACAPPC